MTTGVSIWNWTLGKVTTAVMELVNPLPVNVTVVAPEPAAIALGWID
jgi:hypothetical protein